MSRTSSSSRTARSWLTAAALICLAPVVGVPPAPARADTTRSSVSLSSLDDVLACTRTDQWIESLPLERSLTGQLSYQLSSVRRDLVSPVFLSVSKQFAPRALSARFRDILAVRVEVHKLGEVAQFYRGKLGQRYARADQQVRVDDARAFLAEHPLTQGRRAALERWVDASMAMQRYVTVVVTPAAMLQRALGAFDARKGRGPSEKELMAPMHSKELRNSVIEHAHRTLVDFSDAELAALTRFEQSNEGHAYRAVELDAVRQALEEAFASLTLELEAAGKRVPRTLSRR